MACPYCDGLGKCVKQRECPECDGRGYKSPDTSDAITHSLIAYQEHCELCNGAKAVYDEVPCPSCCSHKEAAQSCP